LRFLKKENPTCPRIPYGFKNLQKFYSLAYGFLTFVVFISEEVGAAPSSAAFRDMIEESVRNQNQGNDDIFEKEKLRQVQRSLENGLRNLRTLVLKTSG
jgi:hypothetical protein